MILLSCSVHYNSRRARNGDQSLYQLFRETFLYESEGFSKTLSLRQRGRTITAESTRGTVHLDEHNGKLRIFVPRNKRDRVLCYSSQLPKALVHYLGISGPAASEIFRIVMTSPHDILDDLLEDDGIIRVQGLEPSNQYQKKTRNLPLPQAILAMYRGLLDRLRLLGCTKTCRTLLI